MSLSPWFYEPFYEPFYSLAEFDKLFDEAFRARSAALQNALQDKGAQGEVAASAARTSGRPRTLSPRMDVHESQETNTVTATFELPGLHKEDVNIELHNGHLVVTGESKLDEEKDENGYHVRERRFGKFSRVLPLSQGAKAEDVKANLEDGVLTVTFPKASQQAPAPQRITVA